MEEAKSLTFDTIEYFRYLESSLRFGTGVKEADATFALLLLDAGTGLLDVVNASELAQKVRGAIDRLYQHLGWLVEKAGLKHVESARSKALLDALAHHARAAIAQKDEAIRTCADKWPTQHLSLSGQAQAWEEVIRFVNTLRGV